MQYHELRVFVPAQKPDGEPIGGYSAAAMVHEAIAAVNSDHSPVIIMWESVRFIETGS